MMATGPGTGAAAPPPDTTFLLLRHGATAHTAQRRFSGCTGANPPLSAVGERQAALVAARLRAAGGVHAVVSSPVARARRTADVVAAALGVAVQVEDDLREIDFGRWEGRTGDEVQQQWPAEVAAWRASAAVAPPGGECVDAVAARVAGVRLRWAQSCPGRTVVLVSHLYPVRVSVLDALGAGYPSVHRMTLEPTSVSEIRATAAGATALVRYNDAAHLDQWPVAGS
jgi:probable phosphoglycerate mutase